MSLIIRVILLYVIGWSDRAIEKGPSALPSVRLLRRRLSAGDSHLQAQLATVPTPPVENHLWYH